MRDFAVIDTETTGLPNQRHNRIIELAIVRLSPSLQITSDYETLINPERDLGPRSVHGITARNVQRAPRFEDIAGDVLEELEGCIIVAHNAPFDMAFLRHEFERLGVQLPDLPSICTMRMVQRHCPDWVPTGLDGCCAALGIAHAELHRAMADARATSELFRFLVQRLSAGGEIDLEKLDCQGDLAWKTDSTTLRKARRTWKREAAQAESTEPSHHLTKLVYRLAGTLRVGNTRADVAGYLDALDRVLEDRVLTREEADALFETAKLWDLRPEDIVEAHRAYLRRLAVLALADNILSEAELSDLQLVTNLLGFDDSFLKASLDEARNASAAVVPDTESLTGKTVCFTGECVCRLSGETLTRSKASELAVAAGLSVKGSVTKKLDLLVVADPDTQSGKAKKARQYGVRVIHEPVFWRLIDVAVD